MAVIAKFSGPECSMTGGLPRWYRMIMIQLSAGLLLCSVARAGDTETDKSLPLTEPFDLPRSTAATGFRYLDGRLSLNPQISFQPLFSSNALELPAPTRSDVGIILSPSVNARYEKNGFSTTLVTVGRYTKYFLYDTQDKNEYMLTSSTRQKLDEAWSLQVDAQTRRNIVSAAALGATPQMTNIIDAQEYTGTISYDRSNTFVNISLRLKNGWQSVYNGATSSRKTSYKRSMFDQINKVGYRFDADNTIYVLFSLNRSIYDVSDAYDRDSRGHLAGVGFTAALWEKLRLKGQFGQLSQKFADPRFKPVSTLAGFMTLNWQIDKTWSAEASWSRVASELIADGTPGVAVNTYGLTLNKQLLPTVLVEARAEWTVQEAIQLPTTYDLLTMSIGAKHDLTPHMTAEYGYRYKYQNTSDNSENFISHTVGAGLTYKF